MCSFQSSYSPPNWANDECVGQAPFRQHFEGYFPPVFYHGARISAKPGLTIWFDGIPFLISQRAENSKTNNPERAHSFQLSQWNGVRVELFVLWLQKSFEKNLDNRPMTPGGSAIASLAHWSPLSRPADRVILYMAAKCFTNCLVWLAFVKWCRGNANTSVVCRNGPEWFQSLGQDYRGINHLAPSKHSWSSCCNAVTRSKKWMCFLWY